MPPLDDDDAPTALQADMYSIAARVQLALEIFDMVPDGEADVFAKHLGGEVVGCTPDPSVKSQSILVPSRTFSLSSKRRIGGNGCICRFVWYAPWQSIDGRTRLVSLPTSACYGVQFRQILKIDGMSPSSNPSGGPQTIGLASRSPDGGYSGLVRTSLIPPHLTPTVNGVLRGHGHSTQTVWGPHLPSKHALEQGAPSGIRAANGKAFLIRV